MTAKIISCSFIGLKCHIIEVQADIAHGLPAFTIVGLGDTSVQESRERVRASIKNSGATFPPVRKTINLAPAQLKKQGALFDVPIAASILAASGQIDPTIFKESIIIGELALNGQIRPVHGVLPIADFAREKGYKKIFLPRENAAEAAYIRDIEVYPLATLAELIEIGQRKKEPIRFAQSMEPKAAREPHSLFSHIVGLSLAKRALAIAAAGGHNLLMEGPPGSGKTLIARAIKEILPPMSHQEILETTKIFSVAGMLPKNSSLITVRPFREVHHTASRIALIGGGGQMCRPGEITLAHNGVLLLDEIAEFPLSTLEALRQPLEDKCITINRANYALTFPASCRVIATMNPCPCGWYGDTSGRCTCTDGQIRYYQKRLSGPLRDRFDLYIQPQKCNMEEIFIEEITEKERTATQNLITAIDHAHEIQRDRFRGTSHTNNADLHIDTLKKWCPLDADARTFLNHTAEKLMLSNRAYLKVLKVSRTIADLESTEHITTSHLAEAIHYRPQPPLHPPPKKQPLTKPRK